MAGICASRICCYSYRGDDPHPSLTPEHIQLALDTEASHPLQVKALLAEVESLCAPLLTLHAAQQPRADPPADAQPSTSQGPEGTTAAETGPNPSASPAGTSRVPVVTYKGIDYTPGYALFMKMMICLRARFGRASPEDHKKFYARRHGKQEDYVQFAQRVKLHWGTVKYDGTVTEDAATLVYLHGLSDPQLAATAKSRMGTSSYLNQWTIDMALEAVKQAAGLSATERCALHAGSCLACQEGGPEPEQWQGCQI